MALDTTEVRSFGFGHVYIADVGETEPADISEAVPAGWTELGHVSDAGPRFSFGKARSPQVSWQSFPDPVRNLKGAAATTVSFDLLQWNSDTLMLALGGGTWLQDSAGIYTYTPAASDATNEKALIIEASDDDSDYRWIFRRTENQANVDFSWTGTALAPLPIVSTVLKADTGSNYIIQTNDANITVASS